MTSVAVRLISRFDEQRLQRALTPLIGKRLRVANRQGFAFGDERSVPVRFPRPGQPSERIVAEYALHVKTSFLIIGAGNPIGAVVERVKGDNTGGARIDLTGGFALELSPGETGEFWRLFRPGTNERHFVVSADGIYLD